MSDLETNHLKLPYLAAAQAQKHVTHNEALRRLDTVVQLAVLDTTLTAPPTEPEEGDRYIVAASPTGAWEGEAGNVATFIDGAWQFAAPEEGWLAFDIAGETLLVRLGGVWEAATSGGTPDELPLLGINATADATNKLAVRSEAVMFSGIETGDGGSGDIRFVVNKEADGDAASILFRSGWSGRAEVGLVGDTDFVFKVSPDGAAWVDAIRIDKDTGLAEILYDNTVSGLTAATVQDAIDEVAAGGGGGGGAVASVFGRTGAVAAAAGDYAASEIDNDSSVTGATVEDALDALATSIAGKQAGDSDLSAIAALAPSNDDVMQRKAGAWTNRTPAQLKTDFALLKADVSLGSVLDVAQAADPGSNGLVARTGSGTAAARTLMAPAAGITVSNGSGVSGNPTLALADDLAALEAMSGTGLVARTAANTYAQRTLSAGNGLAGSNLDGASGNPALAVGAGIGILANADDVAIDKASDANVRAAVSNKVLTADLIETASAEVTITDGGSPAVDWDAGVNFVWTLAANRTFPNPTNGQPGTYRTVRLLGNSGTDRTLAFGTQFSSNNLPTLTTIDNTQQTLLTIRCITASWFAVLSAIRIDSP